jgi:hypothetical protein
MTSHIKKVVFHRHALEQMERRAISREYVRQAFQGPHKTVANSSSGKKKIVANLRGRDLCVIYGLTATEYNVVTAWWDD